jgi:NADH dehydrogenase
MTNPRHAPLPHIVVVGAGFGGLAFCQHFPAKLARITLIDIQNHHLFQPLLYQVASAGLSAVDIAQPIRAIFGARPNFNVIMAAVTGFDLAAKKVIHERGTLDYDYLVVAAGGMTSYFGHTEWEPFAPGLKTLDNALHIRRRILLAFERAEIETDRAKRDALMTIVVVGGGPTGVELAGTFAELSRMVLVKDFDHIDPSKAKVILLEGSPRVLAVYPPDLSASAQRQLEKLGVEVRTNTRVETITEGQVVAGGLTIKAENIVWGAGVAAVPLAKQLGAEQDKAGRVKVLPDCSIPGHPEVFAIGDLMSLVDAKGVTVPGVAQGAIQTGTHVAKILKRELRGEKFSPAGREPFAYFDKGNMATIGRSSAVAEIGNIHISGWLAWIAWLSVHLTFLVSFRSKVSVLIQWTYSYFTYKRGARVITGIEGGPPAHSA